MYPNSGLTLSNKAWWFSCGDQRQVLEEVASWPSQVLSDKVLRSHRHGYGILMRFGADDVKVRTSGFSGERYS